MNILENIDAALAAWETVPPNMVDLAEWGCGSVHCFGGWLITFEHFRALGVRATTLGAPYVHDDFLPEDDELNSTADTSEYLFGDDSLFQTRQQCESGLDDWAIVYHRLLRARAAEVARLAQQSMVL